ncbi:MAG: hypothetical protein M1812_005997 [Candelaria pacifica]|nr:MAG: hypothetical protein M1812_005997 [Candelaria pacifica]
MAWILKLTGVWGIGIVGTLPSRSPEPVSPSHLTLGLSPFLSRSSTAVPRPAVLEPNDKGSERRSSRVHRLLSKRVTIEIVDNNSTYPLNLAAVYTGEFATSGRHNGLMDNPGLSRAEEAAREELLGQLRDRLLSVWRPIVLGTCSDDNPLY